MSGVRGESIKGEVYECMRGVYELMPGLGECNDGLTERISESQQRAGEALGGGVYGGVVRDL